MTALRVGIVGATLIVLWQLLVSIFQLPSYILPSPWQVFLIIVHQYPLILHQAWFTFYETVLGFFSGILIGMMSALLLMKFRWLRFWLMPILLISQAIPTFALAPLLVIWFGYGIASKVITAAIMTFFPVVTTFYDGMRQTPKIWFELANTMQASSHAILWKIQVPAALPQLASGLRVAAAIAPVGAIVGEWVGSSHGLGFLLLNANGRLQIDMVFAVLFVLTVFTLMLYYSVDILLRKLITW